MFSNSNQAPHRGNGSCQPSLLSLPKATLLPAWVLVWLILFAPLAVAQPWSNSLAGQDEVWITLGRDAFDHLRGDPNLSFRAFPLKLEGENSSVVVTQVHTKDLRYISESLHEEFRRCAGFMTHGSREAAERALAPEFRHRVDLAAIQYLIDQEELVSALVDEVRVNQIKTTIERLSEDFPNRFFLHPSGVNSALWIRDLWSGYAGNRDDVTVELFNHPDWAQPSVILTIEGSSKPQEVVVLGGHLDSIASGNADPNFSAPGADDNASGIASLSEVIRAAMELDFVPQRTVKFMGYAAEEVGLLGSQAIAEAYDAEGVDVVAALQFDMTGFNGSVEDFALIDDFTNSNLTAFVGELIDTYQPNRRWTTSTCGYACSDHASWHGQGFPAAFAFEARFNQSNPNIHTPSDTLAALGNSAGHALKFSRLAMAFMVELTVDGTPPAPPSPPLAPSELVALGGEGTIALSWIDTSGDSTKFRIERALSGDEFEDIGSVPGNQTTFVDEGLGPDLTYVYRVRAKNPYGFSGYSNEAAATTTAVTAPPATPTGVEVEAIGSDSVSLAWMDGLGETGYRLESRAVGTWSLTGFTPATESWTPEASVPEDTTQTTLSGLLAETTYEFRVLAENTDGDSEPSEVVRATTWAQNPSNCGAGGGLCLLADAYEVEAAWRVPSTGETGMATPITDSENTGFFWFFNSSNVELVVKVLDGESINQNRWFFYGALSDVEYWIRVTEKASGRTRTYYNPPGELCGLGDTAAFPVLDGSTAIPLTNLNWWADSDLEDRPLTAGTCVPDDETLCLADGRFAVKAHWTVLASGQSGEGSAVPAAGNDKSGFFYFFNPANTELVVKALDGRTINGSWWIFYGALSDVEYELEVVDTQEGATVTYFNENGNLCGRGDTNAFPE